MTPSRSVERFAAWDDSRLVEACRGGEAAAWEALVRRYERLVRAVTRRYRLPDAEAADAFQETFAALVRGLPRMRDGQALCRWIATTAERISYATALRVRREQARRVDVVDVGETIADDRSSGADDLETLEAQALIRQAVAALPERCRQLLGALYFDDPTPSYADLSAKLGLPIGSLGPTRARCFERMRLWIRSRDPGDDSRIRERAVPTYPARKNRGSPSRGPSKRSLESRS